MIIIINNLGVRLIFWEHFNKLHYFDLDSFC